MSSSGHAVDAGSPLGIKEVQDELMATDRKTVDFPSATLRRWVNVYDPLDVVCGADPILANDLSRWEADVSRTCRKQLGKLAAHHHALFRREDVPEPAGRSRRRGAHMRPSTVAGIEADLLKGKLDDPWRRISPRPSARLPIPSRPLALCPQRSRCAMPWAR